MQSVLASKPSELRQATLWNSGFYLWRCGVCPDIPAGIAKAEGLISQGEVAKKLAQLIESVKLVSA
jgi:anthranilate phosphoribosyltransferase